MSVVADLLFTPQDSPKRPKDSEGGVEVENKVTEPETTKANNSVEAEPAAPVAPPTTDSPSDKKTAGQSNAAEATPTPDEVLHSVWKLSQNTALGVETEPEWDPQLCK
ncbi:UNVERIFIED_CONTAM: hypothetical protein FKN15_023887 [Acipenser sinensis]